MSESDVNNDINNEITAQIESLRQKFLADYESNPDEYDESDVQRVRKTDWSVQRFLLSHNMDEDLALKSLMDAMKWRKSFGVNSRTDDYFPDDFYKIGAIFQYNTDKDGLPLLFVRVCVHHKVNDLQQYIREFFVHQVNKIDTKTAGQWVLVCDSTNSGLTNVDMDFSRFIVDVLQNYFPKGFKYVIIHNMPFLMYSFWKLTQYWMSDEVKQLIKTVSGDEIFNYISADNIPQYISGGKCSQSIDAIPDGIKRVEELPHFKHFSQQQIRNIRVTFNLPIDNNKPNDNTNLNSNQ